MLPISLFLSSSKLYKDILLFKTGSLDSGNQNVKAVVINNITLHENAIGYFISYKSGNIDEEIATADHAIRSLGGYIEKIEPEGDDFKLEIMFDKFGFKRLMANYTPLDII